MGIEFDTLAQQAEREMSAVAIVADRKLFLDASQTRLLEEGDRDARWLLASPGHRIPSTEVSRLGLQLAEGKVTQVVAEAASPTDDSRKVAIEDEEAAKKSDVSGETAKSKTPGEDKQHQPGGNKRRGRK